MIGVMVMDVLVNLLLYCPERCSMPWLVGGLPLNWTGSFYPPFRPDLDGVMRCVV